MRNGLVEAVAENAPIPADAWVIDGEGLNVYPGLIDGLSTLGITDQSAIGGGGARRVEAERPRRTQASPRADPKIAHPPPAGCGPPIW